MARIHTKNLLYSESFRLRAEKSFIRGGLVNTMLTSIKLFASRKLVLAAEKGFLV
jgi:hypothetical protein